MVTRAIEQSSALSEKQARFCAALFPRSSCQRTKEATRICDVKKIGCPLLYFSLGLLTPWMPINLVEGTLKK
jgi:hypothetical protein